MNVANDSVVANDFNSFHCKSDTVDYTAQRAEAVDTIKSLPISDIRISQDEVKKLFYRW